MQKISDEIIMAYVDRQLDEEERQRVEQEIKSNPTLKEKVKIFEESSRMLKTVYDDPSFEEIPYRLKSLLDAQREDGVNRRGVPFWQIFKSWHIFRPAYAFVLVAMLVIGIFAFYKMNRLETPSIPPYLLTNAFQYALNFVPSGKESDIKHFNLKIEPTLTFKTHEGK